MDKTLDNSVQSLLREEKIITDQEIAIMIGDKFVAENILTKTRREIYVPNRIHEGTNNRRVLRGWVVKLLNLTMTSEKVLD